MLERNTQEEEELEVVKYPGTSHVTSVNFWRVSRGYERCQKWNLVPISFGWTPLLTLWRGTSKYAKYRDQRSSNRATGVPRS